MHLGAVAMFQPAGRVNPIRLVDLLAQRTAGVRRLRQRVRPTWFPPGGAVWSEDPQFDPARHIHLHRLTPPPGPAALAAAASAVMAQPLDLNRPLWELHLFTGLAGGRFAMLTKMHHALADGLRAVELGAALLDGAEAGRPGPADLPPATVPDRPAAGGPGTLTRPAVDALRARLMSTVGAARATGGALARPDRLLASAVATAVAPALAAAMALPGFARHSGETLGIAADVLRSVSLPPVASPLGAGTSGQRGLAMLRLDLTDVHRIRRRHGGTVNDVLLAVLAGALRQWLSGRGVPPDSRPVRALIPVSRRCAAGDAGGNRLSGYLCDLPVAEPDPVARLHAVRSEMDRNKAGGTARGPGAIPVLAERLPPAVHRLATPFAGGGAPLLFDTVVTNVPLPTVPLYLAGAELTEIYPVVPLADGHALGVAVSTYRGGAYVTLHADRHALPDLPDLAATVPAALATLDATRHAS
jgi:WS/DGAT/MGAT family acyltransferase